MENQGNANVASAELPRFNGDPLSANQWLKDFEKLTVECAFDEAEKLRRASSCFTDFAKEWFSHRDEAFQSWTECKDEFLMRFLRPEAVQADAKVRLRRLRQDEKTDFCEHLIEVQRLCHIADPEMSESERVLWFMKSVRADYRPALVLAGIDSVNLLRDKCALIDTVEPFHNKEPVKQSSPVPAASTSPSHLTFKTKEPENTRQRDPTSANRAAGDNWPRWKRPYCTFCCNYGHRYNTCYRR